MPAVVVVVLALPLAACLNDEEFDAALREAIEPQLARALEPSIRQMTAGEFVELLPGIRINREITTVEFDAAVAIDCHDPETPDVYLEVICCTPDTREHESLLVTRVPPSSVHAALLALGGEPGRPGGWRREGDAIDPVPPEGGRVRVWFITTDEEGTLLLHDPDQWITQAGTGRSPREAAPDSAWVFAGSRIHEFRGREVYDADGTGQLIGLHTFGGETVAWTRVESPDSWIDEPRWLARNDAVPPIGTPVVVRLELVKAPG